MKPRLEQPLFSKATKLAADVAPLTSHIIRAYDSIWSLLYEPSDISRDNLVMNARANLEMLGAIIEAVCGPGAFQTDPRQLSFPENILDMTVNYDQTTKE